MDTPASPSHRHFTLVHTLKRRIRVVVPSLNKDFERTYLLAVLLRKHAGVQSVQTVPEIASAVVYFDPQTLPQPKLLNLLDTLIGNLGDAKSGNETAYALRTLDGVEQPVRDFNLSIEGMSCPSCALLIEVRLRRDPRIASASINFATATAAIRAKLNKDELLTQIGALGYRAYAADTLTQRRLLAVREQERLDKARSRAVWSNLLNLPGLALALFGTASLGLRWFEFATTIPIALWSGWPFFEKAWTLYTKHRSTNMDTLIALGVGLGYSQGLFALLARRRAQYFQAGLAVISFVLLGRYLEEKARGKAHEAIRQLIDRQPQTATLLLDGRELAVGIDEIKLGDRLLVRPGERIPTDGEVAWGLSTVDESLVTGESLSIIKNAGDRVIGGCVNNGGALHIQVTAVGSDTVLAGIIQSVDLAQAGKLPVQAKVDRISQRFMPAVLGLSGLSFVGWLAAGADPGLALTHAISVLLIACPCALGLATPAAIMVGTGEASRRGIFIRRGESLEEASKLTVIVFDKTGTITEGKASITDLLNFSSEPDFKILSWAAAAEFNSEHFLGKALVAEAKASDLDMPTAEDFAYRPGFGVSAKVEGHSILLGNADWLKDQGIASGRLEAAAHELALAGKTAVYVSLDGEAAALFGLADQPRANAKQAIDSLHRMGVKTLMVTGDTVATAEHIARQVGIDNVIGQADPQRKLEIIQQLQAEGERVGMIGDGINDAPALAAADVGFAIASGTDLALETADMSLARGDIAKVAEAMALGRATLHIVRQNLVWALGYNSVAIPLAAFGKTNPMVASIAMSVSSLSLVLNALRLQKKQKSRRQS